MKTRGPGKYDDDCAFALSNTLSAGAFLMVWEGKKGSGVSLKMTRTDKALEIADLLEKMAPKLQNHTTGRYADYASTIKSLQKAEGVLLLIVNGQHGTDVSVDFNDSQRMPLLKEQVVRIAEQLRIDASQP